MRNPTITAVMISISIGSFFAPPSQAAIPSPMSSEVRGVLSAMEADTEQPILARVRGGGGFRAGAASRTRVVAGPRGGAVSRTAVVKGPRGNVAARRTTVVKGPRGNVGARSVAVVRPVRRWVRRPYYGTVVAGVTLGTIIAATAVPPAPSSEVCWYWSNSSHSQGYWDYCQPH
jgi:hypothetical protein